ncbi:MAG: DoxX family protein [Saprospiraceae bacterium]|nr:DoxX family protein [Saprospiraceae bacterium]
MKTIDRNLNGKFLDLALLLLRLQAGFLMLTHGYPKLTNFGDRMDKFADPFGLGSPFSLALVVFAEFVCSILVILGFKVRLAVIPLMITMLIVIFHAHWDDPFGRKELPIMFLGIYIVLLLLGAGKYGIGSIFSKKRI